MRYGYLSTIVLVALTIGPTTLFAEEGEQKSKITVQLGQQPRNSTENSQPPNESWNVSVRGDQAQRNQQEGVEPGMSELTMTVYGGRRDRRRGGKPFGPVHDRRGRALEMDVTSELETCPDGNTRVSALRIGTWRYKMDGSCEDFRRSGHITVDLGGSNAVVTTQSNSKKSADDSAQIRCDPATRTCRTD